MTEENDKLDILLSEMLDQIRLQSTKIDDLSKEVFRKDDFQRFEDKIEFRFDSYDEELHEVNNKLFNHDKKLTDQEIKTKEQDKFRENLHEGVKWAIRVLVAGIVGLIFTILPQFFHFNNSTGVPRPSATINIPNENP